MSSRFSSTIQTYNQHAAGFVNFFDRKLDYPELDKFLSFLPQGGYILDAGCGSARDAAYFIEKGFRALGIDLSEGLLEEAKRVHPEVPTQVMSLTEMNFPSQEFDGIWAKASILHLERGDVAKVIKDFYRILKPAGTLFIQTKKGTGEAEETVPFDANLKRLFTYFELVELEKLVTDAGFEIVESYEFNGKGRLPGSRDIAWVTVFGRKNGQN